MNLKRKQDCCSDQVWTVLDLKAILMFRTLESGGLGRAAKYWASELEFLKIQCMYLNLSCHLNLVLSQTNCSD